MPYVRLIDPDQCQRQNVECRMNPWLPELSCRPCSDAKSTCSLVTAGKSNGCMIGCEEDISIFRTVTGHSVVKARLRKSPESQTSYITASFARGLGSQGLLGSGVNLKCWRSMKPDSHVRSEFTVVNSICGPRGDFDGLLGWDQMRELG